MRITKPALFRALVCTSPISIAIFRAKRVIMTTLKVSQRLTRGCPSLRGLPRVHAQINPSISRGARRAKRVYRSRRVAQNLTGGIFQRCNYSLVRTTASNHFAGNSISLLPICPPPRAPPFKMLTATNSSPFGINSGNFPAAAIVKGTITRVRLS